MDKALLIDSFTYEEYEGKDRYHNITYKEPIEIEHVRIDNSRVYSRDGNSVAVVAEGIIFCYAEHTTPFMMFKEKSRVVIDGREATIEKVVPISQPYSKDLFSIELEVL